jgi:hypothetical protein
MIMIAFIYLSVAIFIILTIICGFSEVETILLMALSGILVGCLI